MNFSDIFVNTGDKIVKLYDIFVKPVDKIEIVTDIFVNMTDIFTASKVILTIEAEDMRSPKIIEQKTLL